LAAAVSNWSRIPRYELPSGSHYFFFFFFFSLLGEHHCYNVDSAFGSSSTTSLYWHRDLAKHLLCQMRGICLIVIPFWYEEQEHFLISRLIFKVGWKKRKFLCDVVPSTPSQVFPLSTSSPIPNEMPREFKARMELGRI
jgi:hypothetical protein